MDRILIVTNRMPWPLKDGGAICMYQSILGYQGYSISTGLLTMNTSRHYIQRPESDEVFSHLDFFREVPVDNSITLIGALKNITQKSSYVMSRFLSKDFYQALNETIEEFQPSIIQYETLFTALYLPQMQNHYPHIQHVYRMHNVEHKIWLLLSDKSTRMWKRKYFKMLSRRLLSEEMQILSACKKVLCIQENEAEWIEDNFPAIKKRIYPFAIESKKVATKELTPINFFHIGSMDWQPNVDAMKWWVDSIWPYFESAIEYPFYMAGRHMDIQEFKRPDQKGMHLVGEVDNIDEFLLDKSVLVIPLRSGGGMRIKVLEAMQKGILVLGTSMGLEGIMGQDGIHFLLANTEKEFIDKMNWIIENPDSIKKIALNATKLVQEKYNLSLEIDKNMEFFR